MTPSCFSLCFCNENWLCRRRETMTFYTVIPVPEKNLVSHPPHGTQEDEKVGFCIGFPVLHGFDIVRGKGV